MVLQRPHDGVQAVSRGNDEGVNGHADRQHGPDPQRFNVTLGQPLAVADHVTVFEVLPGQQPHVDQDRRVDDQSGQRVAEGDGRHVDEL